MASLSLLATKPSVYNSPWKHGMTSDLKQFSGHRLGFVDPLGAAWILSKQHRGGKRRSVAGTPDQNVHECTFST
jgi:hypothetical protein